MPNHPTRHENQLARLACQARGREGINNVYERLTGTRLGFICTHSHTHTGQLGRQ